MGESASGSCAELKVEEFDFSIKDMIKEHDGREWLKCD